MSKTKTVQRRKAISLPQTLFAIFTAEAARLGQPVAALLEQIIQGGLAGAPLRPKAPRAPRPKKGPRWVVNVDLHVSAEEADDAVAQVTALLLHAGLVGTALYAEEASMYATAPKEIDEDFSAEEEALFPSRLPKKKKPPTSERDQ